MLHSLLWSYPLLCTSVDALWTVLPWNLLCTFLPSQKVVRAFKNSLTIILMLYLLSSACTILTQQNVNTGLSQPPAFCTPTLRLLKTVSNIAKCSHYSMPPTVTGPWVLPRAAPPPLLTQSSCSKSSHPTPAVCTHQIPPHPQQVIWITILERETTH